MDTDIDKADELEPPEVIASEDKLRAAVTEGLDVAVISETTPLNPLSDDIVIVEAADVPAGIVKEDGDEEIAKSGVGGVATAS